MMCWKLKHLKALIEIRNCFCFSRRGKTAVKNFLEFTHFLFIQYETHKWGAAWKHEKIFSLFFLPKIYFRF